MARRSSGMIVLPVTALCLLSALGAGAGVSMTEVWTGLFDISSDTGPLIWHLRLPRVVLAFGVGGALGVAGLALQGVVRTPLADPQILGISNGAGVGALAVIALRGGEGWMVPLGAVSGALLWVAALHLLTYVPGRRSDPRVLLLAGVLLGAFGFAIMSVLLMVVFIAEFRIAFLWLLGGFQNATWQQVIVFLAYAFLPLLYLLSNARTLNVMALGGETAESLGMDSERVQFHLLVAAGLLTSATVALVGVVAFVGLIGPMLVRRIWGDLHQNLLPLTFAVGGCFLVTCDALVRAAAHPLELPVGALTALIGLPLAGVLLRRTLTW